MSPPVNRCYRLRRRPDGPVTEAKDAKVADPVEQPAPAADAVTAE